MRSPLTGLSKLSQAVEELVQDCLDNPLSDSGIPKPPRAKKYKKNKTISKEFKEKTKYSQ